jgi:nickel-dependent lactate racemase
MLIYFRSYVGKLYKESIQILCNAMCRFHKRKHTDFIKSQAMTKLLVKLSTFTLSTKSY